MKFARNALVLLFMFLTAFSAARARADAYDPPATYYNSATGTGAALKQQLNDIIDGHTVLSYDSARSNLQITDADPARPGYMLTVYDRTSVHVAAINPGGPIPGWDSAATWNREHVWPASRGPGSSGPDSSDLFELRPALTQNNGDRGNINFGGAYGQAWGVVTDGGSSKWYPGNADAGMIARQAFYMDTRYDGADANTVDLVLSQGNPSTSQGMGDLARLIQWHYAAPPDDFERRRNQIIYDQFQHNRNPFTDRPQWAWSVFVDQANDTQLALVGSAVGADGSSARTVDLGRVLVGAAVPSPQTVQLAKGGDDGTYFSVTASGEATSSINGRYNAFALGATPSRALSVGLSTTTASAGLKSGAVTIDNLDVTTQGGAGRGANDGNDVVTVNLGVLDHARPSFNAAHVSGMLAYNFGTVAIGSAAPIFSFDLFNLPATTNFTAALELDAVESSGDVARLTTNLAPFTAAAALAAGASRSFAARLDTAAPGQFAAAYTLQFSDENLAGAAALTSLTLNLAGTVAAAPVANADYDDDRDIDGADFLAWQRGVGLTEHAVRSQGDANGDGQVDAADFTVWQAQFGVAPTFAAVPEPPHASIVQLLAIAGVAAATRPRRCPGRRRQEAVRPMGLEPMTYGLKVRCSAD